MNMQIPLQDLTFNFVGYIPRSEIPGSYGISRLPRCLSGKESACQCKRHGFDPWVRKNPLEKVMATHSIILTWRSSWIEATVYRVTKTWTWLNMSQNKYDISNLNFLRKPSLLFSIPGTPKFYISTNNAQTSHFSISSPTLVVFLVFVCFLIVATLIYVRWYHTVVLLCVFLMSSCSSVDKESACRAGDPGSIPGLGRSPGEGNGNLLQYPCLENLMDTGVWWASVRRVAKNQAQLSD